MSYAVELRPRAARFLQKRDKILKEQISKRLKELINNPSAQGTRLKHIGFLKIRINDYRAIYDIDHASKKVIVLYIGHRKNVYDDFSKLF